MNNNMYGQPNGTNGVPQNLAQPNMQQPLQPVAPQPTPGASKSGGDAMNNIKNTLSNIDKDSAKRYIGMGSGVLLILSIFLPYMSKSLYGYPVKVSIWDGDATVTKILLILLALVPLATFFLQKAKHLSYLTAGYTLSWVVSVFDAVEGFSGLSFGFWFMTIATIALLVLCIMDDLPVIKTMLSTKPVVKPGNAMATTMTPPPVATPSAAPVQPVAPVPPVQPTPQVPPVVPAAPVAPVAPVQPVTPAVMPSAVPNGPVQPVVKSVEVCNYCGQPKRNPADTVCPSCGQRY